MPRREELDGKKKERLALEHEQLQKLMLQARSSVRRSSLKEKQAHDTPYVEKKEPAVYDAQIDPIEEREAPAVMVQPADVIPPQKQPLTENDLFPVKSFEHNRNAEERSSASQPLFQKPIAESTPSFSQDHRRVPDKIVPEEKVSATALPAQERYLEENRKSKVSKTAIYIEAPVKRSNEPFTQVTPETPNKGKPRSRLLRYGFMMLAALLAGFGGYYLYLNVRNSPARTDRPSQTAGTPAPQKPLADTMVLQTESPVERTNTASGTTAPVEEIKESTPDPTVKTEAAEPRKATTPFAKGDPGLGQYKVISKAYFHNEPDESTRRKAFIIHWNNAVLTPQEEENGFVYIVFTNHLGQTSKGWLQIKDLRRID